MTLKDKIFSKINFSWGKQEGQCTCNVTLMRVHETTVAVESNQYYIFVCVCVCVCVSGCRCMGVYFLSYSVCHAQTPYFLRPLWLHHIFRHYLINDTIFGEKSLNKKCVFCFSLQRLFGMLLILKRIQRDIVINVKTSSCKVPVLQDAEKEQLTSSFHYHLPQKTDSIPTSCKCPSVDMQ